MSTRWMCDALDARLQSAGVWSCPHAKTADLQEHLQQMTNFLHVEDRAIHADEFLA
jgi:hypothetical protein